MIFPILSFLGTMTLASAAPVSPLDTPSVRYVLESTPEGRAVVESFSKEWGPISSSERTQKVIAAIGERPESQWYSALKTISALRFIEHEGARNAPVLEWDKPILDAAAQDGLSPNKIQTAHKPDMHQGLSVWEHEILQQFRQTVEAAKSFRDAPRVYAKAKETFSLLGIPYREMMLVEGEPAIRILSGGANRLSVLAGGLERNLYGTGMVYSPELLLANGVSGAVLPEYSAIALSHLAVMELRADESLMHEIIHVKSGALFKQRILTPFHGKIESFYREGCTPRFSYAKGGYMNLEEIAAFAMNLERLTGRFHPRYARTEPERNWTAQKMQSFGRRGELASVYAQELLKQTLGSDLGDLWKKEELKFLSSPEEWYEMAQIKIRTVSGFSAAIHIPMPASTRTSEQKIEILRGELSRRIRLYEAMRNRFRAVTQAIARETAHTGTVSIEAAENLRKLARAPREMSRIYLH